MNPFKIEIRQFSRKDPVPSLKSLINHAQIENWRFLLGETPVLDVDKV